MEKNKIIRHNSTVIITDDLVEKHYNNYIDLIDEYNRIIRFNKIMSKTKGLTD